MKGDRVLVESPYAAEDEWAIIRNIKYLKACLHDCIRRGEYPFASHLFYTQFLNDRVPEERAIGIEAGLKWGEAADRTVVYKDLGVSGGMKQGIERAEEAQRPVEYRQLPLNEIPPIEAGSVLARNQ